MTPVCGTFATPLGTDLWCGRLFPTAAIRQIFLQLPKTRMRFARREIRLFSVRPITNSRQQTGPTDQPKRLSIIHGSRPQRSGDRNWVCGGIFGRHLKLFPCFKTRPSKRLLRRPPTHTGFGEPKFEQTTHLPDTSCDDGIPVPRFTPSD